MQEYIDDTLYANMHDVALEFGTVLKSRYRIANYFAIGHTSLLYIAEDLEAKESKESKVLVKEFCPYSFANRDLDRRTVVCKGNAYKKPFMQMFTAFQCECEVVQKLKNLPKDLYVHVVGYIDSFQENETQYLVMDFVEGMDLEHTIQSNCTLNYKKTIRSLISIVKGIHKLNILHRDIKPSNIMVRSDGSLVLIDFGSACLNGQTNTEISFASKGYSAPELYEQKMCTKKTDIYSVGAVIYYLTTGIIPLDAMERKKKDELESVSNYAEVPFIMEYFIKKSMVLNEKHRFHSLSMLYLLYL
ncbi:serine/threonine-protein kinase [Anaeromicropila populeti]|uniref:non-specific serine/threonine protein kinase n=1 Tax=Anaeromicropila populeti TaxID=37658 RepID=A0A1I6L262_9FIRM|nr:serine/threonine-protein kinase [Anaeromicropila populeti]SFR97536.1 Protein kinase domain-containing protein [Anaeromicropila populeti]